MILGFLFLVGAVFVGTQDAHAATNIYYSVGQNTTDHKTGSPTVTIDGSGNATFSVAQTATNMGVGDVVTYGGSKVFISGKQSTSVWSVETATGTPPVATTTATVTSIAHAFAKLNDVFNGASNAMDSTHLATSSLRSGTAGGNFILNIPLYYDTGPDTTVVNIIASLLTGVGNYIRIYTATSTTVEVNQSQRHSGVWSSSKYSLETSSSGLSIRTDYVTIDGLQIKVTSSLGSGNHGIYIPALTAGANSITISNNILQGIFSGSSNGHGITPQSANDNTYIYNNIVYGFNASSLYAGIYSYGTTYAYNNTLSGNGRGLSRDSTTLVAKNNIAYNNTLGGDYTGTFSALSTNNLSKDATAPALNTYYINKTLSFTSTSTPGSEDFHLIASDTNAIGKGTNLSTDPDGFLSFSSDIDGQTRSSTWDLGADYYVDVTPPVLSSVASSTADATSTVTWTTDETATSTVEYGLDTNYGTASSSQAFVTSHSISLSGLTASTVYHFRVSSTDNSGNRAVSGDYTFTTAVRTSAPVRSAGAPSTIRPAGTTNTTISLTTDESATCKYSTTAGTAYASMTNTFTTTGSTSHSTTVSGLANGHGYHYYVRCQDSVPNTNTADYEITFRVTDSGTIYADSTAYADVNTAVGLAVSGDTIVVPAGNSTWSSAIEITQPLTILGSGTTTTTITAGGTMPNGFFYVHGIGTPNVPIVWNSNPVRISGFYFQMTDWTPVYGIDITNVAIDHLRIDNNTFYHGGDSQIEVGGAKGVIDNNYFYNGNKAIEFTAGTRDEADASWVSLAAGTSDALFVENNHFIDDANYTTSVANEKVSTYNGGKLVVRYNTFDATAYPLSTTFQSVMTHGSAAGGCSGSGYWQTATGTPCRRGQSVVEVYNNLMTGKRIDFPATVRGSANLIYNNVNTRSAGFTARFYMYEEEQDTPQWSPLRTSWPAEDQVHNSFFWNNTDNGTSMQDDTHIAIGASSANYIQKDRDYFLHAPQSTGGSESFTCANGVTACNGASNTFPTDGNVYRTLGTMVFTASGANAYYGYTPYTCPNPITGSTLACDSSVSGTAGYGVIIIPSLTTSSATSVSTSTATLNGSISATGGANATQSGFAYGTVSNLSTVIATSTLGAQTGTASFTGSLTGLTPNTTYYVRAYATNSAGTGYGSIVSFATTDTTAPTVSLTAPANSSTVSGDSVSLTASASDDVGVSGVQFKLDTNTAIGSEDTTSPYGVTWDSTAVSSGSHTLIAVARDAAGNRATSTAITITTDNTPPVLSSGSPTTAQAAGTTQVTLSLTTNESARCHYGTTASTAYASIANSFSATSTSHSATISGLTDGSSYTYYIRCQDASGNTNTSDYSIAFSVSTAATSASNGPPVSSGTAYNPPTGRPQIIYPDGHVVYLDAPTTVSASIPNSPAKIPPPPATFTSRLANGSKGEEVKQLQAILASDKTIYPERKVTGYFGVLTRKAVERFQKKYGIVDHGTPQTTGFGVVGPKTREKLAALGR